MKLIAKPRRVSYANLRAKITKKYRKTLAYLSGKPKRLTEGS